MFRYASMHTSYTSPANENTAVEFLLHSTGDPLSQEVLCCRALSWALWNAKQHRWSLPLGVSKILLPLPAPALCPPTARYIYRRSQMTLVGAKLLHTDLMAITCFLYSFPI